MDTKDSSLAELHLWRLISPALPVGAYAYSGGLEYAIDQQWLKGEADVLGWIRGVLRDGLTRLDVPVLARLYRAWQQQDHEQVQYWNAYLHSARESAELLAEDQHLGQALARLLADLGITEAEAWRKQPAGFATLFSLAAVHWHIELPRAVGGFLWSWCENQVAAAIKLVPLGQTAGQKLLGALIPVIVEARATGLSLADDDIGTSLPGLAMASAWHEHQYSRLFRS